MASSAAADETATLPAELVKNGDGSTHLKVAWPKWRTWLAIFGAILGVVSFGFAMLMAFRNDNLRRQNEAQQHEFLGTTNELVATIKTQSEDIGEVVNSVEKRQDELVDALVKHAQSSGAVQEALVGVHQRIDQQAEDTQKMLRAIQTRLARGEGLDSLQPANTTATLDRFYAV